jgi:hypothetical protein
MTTTRERLERRWTPGRVVLLVAGIVVTLLVIAAGLALWWLPPVLAETPRERFDAPTQVTVQDAWGTAGVDVAPGWVPLGVGPFLPVDQVTLLSPDGVYRAELGLASLPDASPESVGAALSALLATHDLEAEPAGALGWSEETLTSGATVRYTDVQSGDTTYTVAIVLAPSDAFAAVPQVDAPVAASPIPALTLVAAVPAAEAAAYRTVTADLVASTRFTRVAPPPAASPSGGDQ